MEPAELPLPSLESFLEAPEEETERLAASTKLEELDLLTLCSAGRESSGAGSGEFVVVGTSALGRGGEGAGEAVRLREGMKEVRRMPTMITKAIKGDAGKRRECL